MSKRRDQIIAAAGPVFAAKGYAETTMADLAEAAGVTRPTVYAYFGSKDDVLAGLAQSVRETFLALQDQSGATPAETLSMTMRAYFAAWVQHFGVLTVIAHQALSDRAYADLLDEVHGRVNRRHAKYLERLIADGLARPLLSPQVLVEVVTGAAMRFAQLASDEPTRAADYADELVQAHILLVGFVDNDAVVRD